VDPSITTQNDDYIKSDCCPPPLSLDVVSVAVRVSCYIGQNNDRILTVTRIYNTYTNEPVYNDIGVCDTSSITSDTLWYQLIPRCEP